MSLSRRLFLASAAAAAVSSPALARLDGAGFGLRPGASEDQTRAFQRAVETAAGSRQPLLLGPGAYRIGEVRLPPHTQIIGVRGATRLIFTGSTAMLTAPRADMVTLSGLTIEGNGRPLAERGGLVVLQNGSRVRIEDCEISGATRNGLVLEGVEGVVRQSTIATCAQAGLFALDSRGLVISQNVVRACGNNGILVWRTVVGDDGTLVEGNRIESIAARDGGSGQNGNGVNVYRAANVRITGNRMRECAFSAVRGNAASNLIVTQNSALGMGETAIYVEFGFEGAVISGNTIDGAALGIVSTNFNNGGRLATIQGNMIRNMIPRRPAGTDPGDIAGVGIAAEADAAISGNVIENAPSAGIWLGWGQFLRDVSVTGNVVRQSPIGIAVSVVPGAGAALIADNLIQGATRGAVVGMEWKRPVTPDMARDGTGRFAQLTVSGNRLR